MNIECRSKVFCPFKIKTEQAYFAEKATKAGSKIVLRNSIRLPWTGYIRLELLSKAGPEFVEGYGRPVNSKMKHL